MANPLISFGSKLWDDDKGGYEDRRFYRRDLPAGAAEWINGQDGNIAALQYICPCGCGYMGCVNVKEGEKVEHAWQWDGNREKPTLSPSIQQLNLCRWHGFLQAGVWVQC